MKNSLRSLFVWDDVREMFRTAVEQEIAWTTHIIGEDILGVTDTTTDVYTKYLANKRWKAIGRNYPLYEEEKYQTNPYKHLEKLADTESGNVKSNFFEATVTSYKDSSAVDGWDEI